MQIPPAANSPVSESQAWRPRFHFTPLRNWMNDPNGLVFFDGEFHLYYQYNPLDTQWGNISWGHAVSPDLVTWSELPVAILASDRLMAFSGSVIVDHDNTGGFAPEGSAAPALVAFFTGFDPVSKIQSQHLAVSLDRGRSYTPYVGNPVIDIGATEFRDPKVFWHAPTRRWVMLVVAALQQQVWFYTSADLKQWDKVSSFGPAGSAANNIWEVPDLVELPLDGDGTRKRWVLIVSVNHGTLWGGSGVQYFIGSFDGTRFTADDNGSLDALRPSPGWQFTGTASGSGPVSGSLAGQQHVGGHLGRGLMNSFHGGGDAGTGTPITLWADHGRDFYAPITFANLPGDRVLWLGWMSNWDYASALPTPGWRGQQSLPRQIDLMSTPRGPRLRQRVADEVQALVAASPVLRMEDTDAAAAARALATKAAAGGQWHARLAVCTAGLRSPVGLEFFKGAEQALRVGYDPARGSFFVDRTTQVPRFAGQSERHDAARLLDDAEVTLEVWIDGSTVELFADGGSVVISDLVYAAPDATGVALFHGTENPRLTLFALHTVPAAVHLPPV